MILNDREVNLQGNCTFLDGKAPFVSREMKFKHSQPTAADLLSIRMHSFAVNASEHCTPIVGRQMKTGETMLKITIQDFHNQLNRKADQERKSTF